MAHYDPCTYILVFYSVPPLLDMFRKNYYEAIVDIAKEIAQWKQMSSKLRA